MGHTNPSVSLTWWFYNRIFLGNAAMLLKIVDRLAAFRQRNRLETLNQLPRAKLKSLRLRNSKHFTKRFVEGLCVFETS
jgi:hypothetical protein